MKKPKKRPDFKPMRGAWRGLWEPGDMRNLGPLIGAVRFLIHNAAKDDYLMTFKEDEEKVVSTWSPLPAKALKFDTLETARAAARSLVETKGYSLVVCELLETEATFAVRPIAEIGPGFPPA